MRCPRCGNENPGTNRFCGMCGATLLPAPPTASATQATAISPAPVPAPAPAPPAPPAPRPPARAQEAPSPSPSISGPSFLGLNDPPPTPRRGSLSINPNSAPPSRSLDYLLEDEEPHGGGAGKYFLILIALLLAVGLGYLRWKNGGFGFLNPPKKPTPAVATDDTTDTAASQPATPSQPAATAPNSAAQTPSITPPPAQDTASPASSAPAATPPTSQAPSADAPNSGTPAASSPTTTKATPAKPAATTDAENSDADTADDSPAPSAKPKPAPVAEKPTPSRAVDPVAEAQKYLYGKGARQDCDRGLRLLKPQADRANPKAMVEMGALYSAGLCTPRDLPTAYRWFALALRKDPENQSAQADLQKLWGEMTQPERQLAIRLSQ